MKWGDSPKPRGRSYPTATTEVYKKERFAANIKSVCHIPKFYEDSQRDKTVANRRRKLQFYNKKKRRVMRNAYRIIRGLKINELSLQVHLLRYKDCEPLGRMSFLDKTTESR